MYLSLFLNPGSSGPDNDLEVFETTIAHALEADKAGLAAIFLTEHHFSGHNTYTDPFMFGSYLAPQLSQAYIGIAVMCAPFHNPLRMVESCNILDVLTRGRCIIGMGPGFSRPGDLEPFGMTRDQVSDMTDQRMEVMLKVWARAEADPPLDVSTDWDQGILTNRVSPAPFRKPHPLFGRGTTTDATVVRNAELGLPVMFGIFVGLDDDSRKQVQLYRDTLRSSGHSPERIAECERFLATSKAVYVVETEAEAEAYYEQLRPFHDAAESIGAPRQLWGEGGIKRAHVFGTPESVAEQIKAYSEVVPGFRCAMLPGPGGPPISHAQAKKSFRLLMDEVVPLLDLETYPDPPEVQAEHSLTAEVSG
ncbi:LLM class flavin-dependent oxidoreductase [Streptomyces sp. NPDC047072]|uniref:LLM class flavin-dependent oxidoreductase n=1 Tax=Streptomyces sp. NPDC047072 TaxID=3154809 RepID=UPI0033D72FF7